MVTDGGEADSRKFGEAVTVIVTTVLCLMPPPLPVTVMG